MLSDLWMFSRFLFSSVLPIKCSTPRNPMKPTVRFTSASLALLLLLLTSILRADAESLYPDSVTPAGRFSDAPSWELGTVFRAALPGNLTEVRVFSLAEEFGDHQVRIWRNADN